MREKRKKLKKAIIATEYCVACGSCVSVCPNSALKIKKGIHVVGDEGNCVGCGKCVKECPASIIELLEVAV